jgi:hypothetical protein
VVVPGGTCFSTSSASIVMGNGKVSVWKDSCSKTCILHSRIFQFLIHVCLELRHGMAFAWAGNCLLDSHSIIGSEEIVGSEDGVERIQGLQIGTGADSGNITLLHKVSQMLALPRACQKSTVPNKECGT